jgi:hypothetical protein
MQTWQENMRARADEARIYAIRAGANGWCIDEGDEHRPAVFKYSRLDALTVARWGDYGEYATAHANSKDLKKQIAVADWIAGAEAAREAGVEVITDVTERQLGKAEFFARRAAGAKQLMAHGRYATQEDAQREWMKREAEVETGFSRDDPNPAKRKKWNRVYRNLCNRDRKS